jgi:hypothetical protein
LTFAVWVQYGYGMQQLLLLGWFLLTTFFHKWHVFSVIFCYFVIIFTNVIGFSWFKFMLYLISVHPYRLVGYNLISAIISCIHSLFWTSYAGYSCRILVLGVPDILYASPWTNLMN